MAEEIINNDNEQQLRIMFFMATNFFTRDRFTLNIFKIIIFAYGLCIVVGLFKDIIKEVKKDFE